jgi:hypothetical protein
MKNRSFYSQLNHFVPGPEKGCLMRASSLSCMSTWQQTWPETQRISLLPRGSLFRPFLRWTFSPQGIHFPSPILKCCCMAGHVQMHTHVCVVHSCVLGVGMALVPSSFLNHPDSHTSASREAQAGAWLDMMKVSGAFVTTNLILP